MCAEFGAGDREPRIADTKTSRTPKPHGTPLDFEENESSEDEWPEEDKEEAAQAELEADGLDTLGEEDAQDGDDSKQNGGGSKGRFVDECLRFFCLCETSMNERRSNVFLLTATRPPSKTAGGKKENWEHLLDSFSGAGLWQALAWGKSRSHLVCQDEGGSINCRNSDGPRVLYLCLDPLKIGRAHV